MIENNTSNKVMTKSFPTALRYFHFAEGGCATCCLSYKYLIRALFVFFFSYISGYMVDDIDLQCIQYLMIPIVILYNITTKIMDFSFGDCWWF